MLIGNFYLKDGYHQDVKIIEISKRLPIKNFIYLDKSIVKILLETTNTDITIFFNSGKIKTIEIYSDKFIITREENAEWNIVIALFISSIDHVFNNKESLTMLCKIEQKLNSYQEYQMKNTDIKILSNMIYISVYKKIGETFKDHNGGFEIIDINMYEKNIHLRLIGSCSGCTLYKQNVKELIIKEINKILVQYKIYFYN